MPGTLERTLSFCFNNVFHYAPLDLNYLFVRLLKKLLLLRHIFIISHVVVLCFYHVANLSYSKMQVIVEYVSVIHLYSVAFVLYVWNLPYYFALVIYFTILHFYWIEFVAIMLWKDLIFSDPQLIVSFYY